MVFTGAPSAINPALALRQAIWRKTDPAWAMCGIPDILHVDHGSDFTSDHIERTAVALHIRIIHSTIGRPQGRGKIERFFGTVNTELLAALPGHLGPGSRTPTPAVDLAGLDRAIGGFIGTYNDRTHSELGISPRDAWVADGWLPRMPDSLQELDGLLLNVPKNRVVQRDGIHFQGQRYLAPTLAPFVGHTITITKPTPTSGSASATSKSPAAPAASNCAEPLMTASQPLPPAKNPAPPNPRSV